MAKTSIDVDGDLVQRMLKEPSALAEVLRVLCESAMRAEVAEHLGASLHERAAGRRGHRNGNKERTLKTRVGEIELSVPQVRDCERGPYRPSLFGKYERSERAALGRVRGDVLPGRQHTQRAERPGGDVRGGGGQRDDGVARGGGGRREAVGVPLA